MTEHPTSQASPEPSRTASLSGSKNTRFEVLFTNGLSRGEASPFNAAIAGRRALVVTTPTVDRVYGAALRQLLQAQCLEHTYEVMRLGERRKQLNSVAHVCRLAANVGLDRRGVLIAIGGGVCSDIVTVAASMIRRGVEHIRVPTTLVGQIDAGIGIKGAVNFNGVKSFVGCFHPPAVVFIDPLFLRTLPVQYIGQGLAEILKMALILDPNLFLLLERFGPRLVDSRFQEPANEARFVLEQAIRLMLAELQRNPYEDQTFERLVDMGHTFSPTLEARSEFRISHGDAVALDLALSCAIGVELGEMTPEAASQFIKLLLRLRLPASSHLLTSELCHSAIRSSIAHRGGRLNLVVPRTIGESTFVGAEALYDGVLEAALDYLRTLAAELARARPDTRASHFQGSARATPAL